MARTARRSSKPKAASAPRRAVRRSSIAAPDYLRLPIGSKVDGGLFAGITYADGRPHALVLGPENDGEVTWQAAVDWAKTVKGDYVLPSRLDLAILYANLRKEFRPTSYWSCEQHASNSAFAWLQYFDGGNQLYWFKNLKLRARLVRRSAI